MLLGQSAKGGAFAFKMEVIEKTADIRAVDNKHNLLMYIID